MVFFFKGIAFLNAIEIKIPFNFTQVPNLVINMLLFAWRKKIIVLQVVDKCFAGTASRLSGVTFEMLGQEVCNYSPFSAQWHMPNQWSVYFKCKIIIIFDSLFYRHWTSTVLHFLTENVTMSSSTTRYSIVFLRSWSF